VKSFIFDTSALIEGQLISSTSLKIFIKLINQYQNHRVKLYSIPLMFYEYLNALRFNFDAQSSNKLFKHLLTLKIEIIEPTLIEIEKAIELSFVNNTTYYDTIYHTIALGREMTLLTMDKKYYKSAKKLGNISLFNKLKL